MNDHVGWTHLGGKVSTVAYICAGCVPFIPGRPHRCCVWFATLQVPQQGPRTFSNERLRTVTCECTEEACMDRQVMHAALRGVF